MHPELERLLSAYPLAEQWTRPELYIDEMSVGSLRMEYAGLVSQDRSGMAVTASAASRKTIAASQSNLTRAYFELLERTSLIDAERMASEFFSLHSFSRVPGPRIAKAKLFPQSPHPDQWRFAKSNGVAAHLSWEEACKAAALELVERDRILRSWYGERGVTPVPLPAPEVHVDLGQHYEIQAYRLGKALEVQELGKVWVVVVVGLPRHAGAPRIGGFAARLDEADAIAAATRECLQCMSFLWGESIPDALPPFSPSPDYHQEAFLTPRGIGMLRHWLLGGHAGHAIEEAPSTAVVEYADLTPVPLAAKIVVVKAFSPSLLPLTFGRCADFAPAGFPPALLIHPVT